MEFYTIGINEDEVGLFTPQNVLDQMNLINDAVNSMDRVISPSEKARPEFKSAWITFRDNWRSFYAAHTGGITAWFSRALNETNDQVQDYHKRALAWQDAASKEGLTLVGPSPLIERSDKVQTYILYGGLVIGGIVVAYGLGKYVLNRLFSIGED